MRRGGRGKGGIQAASDNVDGFDVIKVMADLAGLAPPKDVLVAESVIASCRKPNRWGQHPTSIQANPALQSAKLQ